MHFAKSADSTFDRFSYAPTPARQQWMRDKYWRMRAYSAVLRLAHRLVRARLVLQGRDGDLPGREPDSSDFYLRDAQGRKLYVWFDCGGGSCPQFAGDIGSPAFRAHWIADAKRMYQAGYKGLFVDDVNMELRISDGNGNLQWPVDPRTGSPDERGVMAALHGGVHGADPPRDPGRRDRPQLALVQRRRRSRTSAAPTTPPT